MKIYPFKSKHTMKKIPFLLLACCFYLACTPTAINKTTVKTSKTTEITPLISDTSMTGEEVSVHTDLATHLNKIPGVRVLGTAANPCVSVRGPKPLFIINGNQIGYNFQIAADYVRHQQIKSVKVLPYFETRGLYTLQGNNGVILIETK